MQELVRLRIYQAYAWGVPLVIMTIAIILDNLPNGDFLRPRFGQTRCGFDGKFFLHQYKTTDGTMFFIFIKLNSRKQDGFQFVFKPLVINDEKFEIKKGTPFLPIYVTHITYKQILLYVFFVQTRSSYLFLLQSIEYINHRFIAFFHSRFNSDEVIVVDCKGDCELNVILLSHNSIDSPDYNI